MPPLGGLRKDSYHNLSGARVCVVIPVLRIHFNMSVIRVQLSLQLHLPWESPHIVAVLVWLARRCVKVSTRFQTQFYSSIIQLFSRWIIILLLSIGLKVSAQRYSVSP